MPVIIPIDGFIGLDVTVNEVRKQIKAAGDEEITFEISSPGGQVSAGIAIYNLIKNVPQKTTAHIIGVAASMSSVIPLAANEVTAESISWYMIHNTRSMTFGDRHTHNKRFATMQALDKMLVGVYTEKTGKSISEIEGMMDEEAEFFGEGIKTAGFVDKIIKSDSTDTKEEAHAFANLQIESCQSELKKSEPEDLGQIAAILNTQAPKPAKTRNQQPKAANNENPQTKVKMDLDKLLAENPEAKATYQERILTAEKKGVDSVEARIKQMSGFLSNEHYSNVALKGLTGELSTDSVMAVITMKDQELEAAAALKAAEETEETPDTPADGNQASPNGEINNEQDMDALIEKNKKQAEA